MLLQGSDGSQQLTPSSPRLWRTAQHGNSTPLYASSIPSVRHAADRASLFPATATAGTSIEPQGRALEQLFNEVVAPVLAAAPQLYPAPYNTFQHFLRAADMTQTRAFHMVAENWVTGVSQV
jgi:hypothetical protein